jgi:release factor glutamine methyltransferase
VPTAGELVRDAERRLKASSAVEHPHAGKERHDARELLAFVLGEEPDDDAPVPPGARKRFERLLRRREAGEPLAYLTGRAPFRDLTLAVGPGCFIPRESTEFLAEQAIRRLRRRSRPVHVDLATGVGPVALAVARAVPEVRGYGVDLSARPLALARRNARTLGVSSVSFLRGDLFSPLPRSLVGRVDVITIHPPYVGRREVRELPAEIARFEPLESLTDFSPRGMRLVERVAAEAPGWLRPGGWLLVEVAPYLGRSVAAVLRRAGLREVRVTKGGPEVTRVVIGRR